MEKVWSWMLAGVAVAVFILALAMGGEPASPQELPEMKHPGPGESHWYDAICCSNQDCRPLLPSEYKFQGGKWWLKNSQGEGCEWTALHEKWRVKISKDFNIHGCFADAGKGCKVYCIYVGGGV